MEFAIYIIERNEVENRQMREMLGRLSHPVRVLEERDLDAGRSKIDIVLLGISESEKDITGIRARISRIRSLSPEAQIILCTPDDTKGLDTTVLHLEARAFLLKPIEESTFVTLLNKILTGMHRRKQRDQYLKSGQRASRIT